MRRLSLLLVVSMDLRWTAALAIYVGAGKLLPHRAILSKAAGVVAVAPGAVRVAGAALFLSQAFW
ncbi:hypothetical protein D9R14_18220 [Xanthobacter tagetidis]|uniref:Uncharacterized protein n=1 Tax=Xanthobacter tagetidis TaxID=60216 RepID=A0A3L7A2S1_9HYPH|nr:hypothetical protein D9R14_18220 [Xanthobacter tagetidis]